MQVAAATDPLNTCVKLSDNPLDRMGAVGSQLALVDGASLFLERATNDKAMVFLDVVREECHLLDSVSFHISSPTTAEWVEALFKENRYWVIG